MRRVLLCSLGLLLVLSGARAEDAKEKPRAGTPAEQFAALEKEFDTTLEKLQQEFRAAQSQEDRQKIRTQALETMRRSTSQAIELAEKNPKDPVAVKALVWALERARAEADQARVLTVLTRDQLQNPKLGEVCTAVAELSSPAAEKFLREVLAKSSHRDVQGRACLALALQLQERASDEEETDAAKLARESAALLEQAAKQYGDVKTDEGSTIGATAKQVLSLAVGQVPPDIEGEDGEDKKFKLSDYRGKVVLLDFWASWCGPCMALVPHNRALVKKFEGKPFVLLGVNSDNNKDTFKKAAEKAQINWRSFFDGSDGKIVHTYRIKAFPTLLVLDHKGVMRYKFVGAGPDTVKAVDEAVEKLVKEAEAGPGRKTD